MLATVAAAAAACDLANDLRAGFEQQQFNDLFARLPLIVQRQVVSQRRRHCSLIFVDRWKQLNDQLEARRSSPAAPGRAWEERAN